MKNRVSGGDSGGNAGRSSSAEGKNASKNLKRNKRRLGGGGLSLEAFANLKSKSNGYNPAIIKKQREFYKNAKYISKYKKVLKKEELPNELSMKIEPLEDDIEAKDDTETSANSRVKKNKHKTYKLNELYEQKRQEDERARKEREAIIQAKEQARKEALFRRKTARKNMFKKTRSGQPVMKYRMEQLLETIQASVKK
uniref:rRNA-processing protein FYV7 n=1 Tax=Kalanchoe fedtschenkoi TaxID=63787 RepID=A0A7N0ZT19_KALFE